MREALRRIGWMVRKELLQVFRDPRMARLVLVAPAGLGDSAPWWWHAISGRWINWPALLRR